MHHLCCLTTHLLPSSPGIVLIGVRQPWQKRSLVASITRLSYIPSR